MGINMCKCEEHDDLTFVIMTDKCSACFLDGWFMLEALSLTTVVVETWVKDYYFPHVDRRMEYQNGIYSSHFC